MRDEALYRAVGALETEEQPLDELQAARLARRAREMAGLAQPAVKSARRWKLALAAAVLLALTACAVAGFSAGWFGSYATDGDAQQSAALLTELGTVIGESRTAGGYTVTLLGAISDGYDAVLAFSALPQDKEAAPLDSRSVFTKNYLVQKQSADQLQQEGRLDLYDWFAAEDLRLEGWPQAGAKDGALLFTARYELRGPNGGGALREPLGEGEYLFSLGGLQTAQGGQLLAEGPWEFAVTLSPVQQNRDLALGQTEGGWEGYTLAQLRITPLNLSMVWENAPADAGSPPMPEGVRLADGQEILGGLSWTNRNEEQGAVFGSSGCKLKKAVDPQQVQAVRVGGVWYALEQSGEGWALRETV